MKKSYLIHLIYFTFLQLLMVYGTILNFKTLIFISLAASTFFYVYVVYLLVRNKILRGILFTLVIWLTFVIALANRLSLIVKKDIITISSLKFIDEAIGVGDSVAELFNPSLMLVLIVPLITTIVVIKFGEKESIKFSFRPLIVLAVTASLIMISSIKTNADLYMSAIIPTEYAKNFGVSSYYLREALPFTKRKFDESEPIKRVVEEPKEEYVSSVSGLYADKKNVIFLMAESLSYEAIDENLTPTLYNISQNGMVFENYYTTTLKTNISEYAVLTSLSPPIDYTTVLNYKNAQNSIPEAFEDNGYCTLGFHSNTMYYFDRNQTYPNTYKFQNSFFDEDMNLENYYDWALDKKFFDESLQYVESLKCEKNFNYYMTVTGHSTYDPNLRPILWENWNKVHEVYPEYDSYHKGYLAAQMHFDSMVERAIQYYTDIGEIDDTLFVIVADHYPYALVDTTNHHLVQSGTYSSNYNNEPLDKYNIPFIIYDPSNIQENNTEYGSNIDVFPTLIDLFGFESDNYPFVQGFSFFNDKVEHSASWYGHNGFSHISDTVVIDDEMGYTYGDEQSINSIREMQMNFAARYYSLYEE